MARLIDQIVGHEATWTRLLFLVESERLPHAMAFVGPSGIGKKMMAWALAQALVCPDKADGVEKSIERGSSRPRPCGQCPSCKRIAARQSESVLYFEPGSGAGTIKLESAQTILNALSLQSPFQARVVLIDQAQALNPQAANALLKVIEEPPANVFFVLIASEASQFLPTLRSRLQIQRFSPLSEDQVRRALQLSGSSGGSGHEESERLSHNVSGNNSDSGQSDAPSAEWIIRCARGSLERLETLRDPQIARLRAQTLEFLGDSLAGRREGLDGILDQAKERESAKRAITFLQQILRDWCLIDQQPEDVIHADLGLNRLPRVALQVRLDLWRTAFGLEMDLAAHVDRSLLFENFFYRAKGSVSSTG